MVDFKENNVGRYIKSIPLVKFNSMDHRMAIANLFDTKRDISEYLGLVLLRLRFKADDTIVISNYDRKKYSFDCVVNERDYYNIRFENIKSSEGFMKIVVSRFNTELAYECIPTERTELGMKVSLSGYSVKYPEGKVFTRCLSETNAIFKVELDNYVLELELQKPDDIELPLFDSNGRYSKYRLGYEEEIFQYLGSLEYQFSIVDIYKKIVESYLGDLSKYPKFSLKVSQLNNSGELVVTDLILLKNGNLEKFGMTVCDKTVFIDKDDNWSFEVSKDEAVPVSFAVSYLNGNVNCSFSASEDVDIDDYTKSCLRYDFNLAQREIIEVKRRVRELFNKNNKGSN